MRALGDQLADGLRRLTPAPLDMTRIGKLEARPGVYQLYEGGCLVYVGKADKSLPQRLTKHYVKLTARLALGPMTFTCLYVDEDLHAVAPERLLIQRQKDQGLAQWNFNGFGSNDPGRNRDETLFESNHFDSLHPADLAHVCKGLRANVYRADLLLKQIKAVLPYLFRYESASFHRQVEVRVDHDDPTADELFAAVGIAINKADPKWRITALPGYVIMYPKPGPYPSARRQYPAPVKPNTAGRVDISWA
ncbi:GIY-YIG nuclease family protein [Nocardia ninae]|nr:GIY-YIG nuclease family protein [Nocardia ninae]